MLEIVAFVTIVGILALISGPLIIATLIGLAIWGIVELIKAIPSSLSSEQKEKDEFPNEEEQFQFNGEGTYQLIIKSDPGQALVLADYSVGFGRLIINYLILREVNRAIKLFFLKEGNCYYIMLDN